MNRTTLPCTFWALMVLALGLGPVRPAERRQDDEDAEELRVRGLRTMQANCLFCHSQELIDGQRLTARQWDTAVKKMIDWGAPVPLDEVPALLAYLKATYPSTAPPLEPPRLTPAEIQATLETDPPPPEGDPAGGRKLYQAQCATCHGPTGRGGDLGPNLVEKPILDHFRDYRTVMYDGRRRMPGFRLVLKPGEDLDILAWLRNQHGP